MMGPLRTIKGWDRKEFSWLVESIWPTKRNRIRGLQSMYDTIIFIPYIHIHIYNIHIYIIHIYIIYIYIYNTYIYIYNIHIYMHIYRERHRDI